MSGYTIDPGVRVGHVHLRVADLERSKRFYCDVLGLTVTADARPLGVQALFLAAGDYHHHLGLSAVAGGSPPPAGHTGLYHFALVYPGAAELADAVERLRALDHPIDLAQDHGGTVSVYLRDPDGNGIELYFDRPRDAWYDGQGKAVLKAERISVEDVLRMRETAAALV